jgi:hypothetical protein
MVKLDGNPGDAFTIRVAGKLYSLYVSQSNTNSAHEHLATVVPQIISGYAVLQYESSDDKNTADFVKPAKGYPALPTSTPYMDYAGVMIDDATVFDYASPAAAPYIAFPPPSNDQVSQTIKFNMARPNATTWVANGTGLPHTLYEANEPLIWTDVWQGVEQALDENEGSFAGTPLLMANSIAVVPELGSVVDLIFIVRGGK